MLARVLDKYDQCQRRNIPAATAFLSEAEQAAAQRLLNAAGIHSGFVWNGGYEGAERKILQFLPDWAEEDDSVIACLRAAYRGEGQPTHRDCLGSLMGLGITREKLGDILTPGMNGSTFGGNPVACAGARVVVRRVSDPAFLQSVKEKGAYLKEKLEAMPQVEYVRGRGMMIGVKVKGKDSHDVLVDCAKAGLLILTAKDLVRFLPPLTITQKDMDEGLAIFQKVLEQ